MFLCEIYGVGRIAEPPSLVNQKRLNVRLVAKPDAGRTHRAACDQLADVFDVAGQLIIDGDAFHQGDFLVVVKPGVSVATKIMDHDRAEPIWVAPKSQICIRSIDDGVNVAGWGNGNCLG